MLEHRKPSIIKVTGRRSHRSVNNRVSLFLYTSLSFCQSISFRKNVYRAAKRQDPIVLFMLKLGYRKVKNRYLYHRMNHTDHYQHQLS